MGTGLGVPGEALVMQGDPWVARPLSAGSKVSGQNALSPWVEEQT